MTHIVLPAPSQRELFCYAFGCEIRRLRSYLTPLCYARNRCSTSSACHFAPADLVLHVSPSAPYCTTCSLTKELFCYAFGCEIRRYRKSTHLVGKCFAVFNLVFQIFYDFTQYPNFVFLIWERQINPFLVD